MHCRYAFVGNATEGGRRDDGRIIIRLHQYAVRAKQWMKTNYEADNERLNDA